MIIYLRLKGDNRLGNIHYGADEGTNNRIIFINGEEGQAEGSITVADFPNDLTKNHWGSAIGGDDNKCDSADGIVIKSGVIYAGTTYHDNCTAIGGGGNNFGGVTIENGIVTAVAATTGTAIGGGIGWNGGGGNAKVVISGGTIYAYNLGIQTVARVDKYKYFVPAVAIGGGSSQNSAGNERTIVNISDGTVYAQSTGGAAIGGGGSTLQTGGNAEINITGGKIIAKSTTGKYKGTENDAEVDIPAGVSIGGGTGKTGGGSVTLNISGESTILRTGSIGGGKTTESGNIGSANVIISGGDITGQVIMAGGAAKNCSFTMTDGKIHGTDVVHGNTITDIHDPQRDVPISYIEENGGAVWMEDEKGITTIEGGTIEGCTARNGGAIYMQGGTFTMSGGTIGMNTAKPTVVPTIYPDFTHTSVNGTGLGGAVYIQNGTVEITGGSIEKNKAAEGAGVYVTGGDVTVSKGGSINDNNATLNGGGIFVTGVTEGSNGNVTINGGRINGNTAGIRGGGVYLPGGSFTMGDRTEILKNKAGYRGGGIFLMKTPTLNDGVIAGNEAGDSGGGLCINGDKLELKGADVYIYGNQAKNGGGVAVLNGEFIIDGGNIGMTADTPMPLAEGGDEWFVDSSLPNKATENGGGVYVAVENSAVNTSVTVKKGQIWHNEAKNGGGVYLAKGIFTMNSDEAIISQNHATENGGGIYLYTDPNLLAGQVALNKADVNGGGMYIDGCMVNLEPSGNVNIARNEAKNGGGIYIHGNSYISEHPDSTGGSAEVMQLDAISTATPANDTGLKIHDKGGKLTFAENVATESGGAICIEKGGCELSSVNIGVVANKARNGGGVAVLNGNFTMTKGSIGAEGTLDINEGTISNANTASNGGGVYVSEGDVWLLGGKIQYNKAELDRESGETSGNRRSTGNGGGIYVSEGDINVVYSEIEHNFADWDGGGFFVSAIRKNVNVVMLSGSLCYNEAKNSGGGMSVESDPTNPMVIDVKIGCLLDHKVTDNTPQLPIKYTEDYSQYEEHAKHYIDVDAGQKCEHISCPIVKNNKAVTYGGGFYMNSKASKLTFYCIDESNNVASSKESTEGLDIEGGTIVIGDITYHNYAHAHKGENTELDKPRGYIIMDNATLVIGGTVDIYGDMANPIFRDPITVDIQDKKNDHFFDHRRVRENEAITHYKVHYIENFFGTGLYQEHNYTKENSNITIQGILYSHPGYRILGWYTAAEYNPVTDENQKFYPVGETFNLSDKDSVPQLGEQDIDGCDICKAVGTKDETLLKLYAIWEANGYTIHFEPNMPDDAETYTGSMEDQIFTYKDNPEDIKPTDNLHANNFHIDGYVFKHWALDPDGIGEKCFADKARVVNLTTENGVTINLYAIWEKCDHTHPERWSYRVDPTNPSTLIRDCSCGGQTLRATLYANDTVYDGLNHPAVLTYDALAWGEDKPIVTYTGEWFNDGLTHTDPIIPVGGEPFHAGNYTATITKRDVKLTVSYTIAKADQPAPAKPTYTASDDRSQLIIKKSDNKSTQELTDEAGVIHTANAEYCLVYYVGDVLQPLVWKKIPDGTDSLSLNLETAYTNYYVEARYEELEDYNASEVVMADAVYYFGGNVSVVVIRDEGIDYKLITPLDKDIATDGLEIELTTQNGYYLVSGNYKVETKLDPAEEGKPTVSVENDNYKITDIPSNSTLTITIGKARKKPVTASQLTPGQVFRPFSGTGATISRDSAFTAAFQITNFDPYVENEDGTAQGVYDSPVLKFGSNIPEKSTIILLDRSDNSYWYYTAGSGGAVEIPLTEFKKMGGTGTEKYTIQPPMQNDDVINYLNLSYQFIVDFSQCDTGYVGNSLVMTIEAAKHDPGSMAPAIDSDVTVNMETSSFALSRTSTDGSLTQSLEANFTAGGTASKWEKRSSALILTPKNGTTLPLDARIKAVVDGRTTYIYNSGDKFIVPMSLLKSGGGQTVKLTLQSSLFPVEGKSYAFDAEWLISRSKADKSPMNGDQTGTPVTVTFTSGAIAPPSLKPSSDSRVMTSSNRLELNVEWANMDDYLITATLQQKNDEGSFADLGWSSQQFNEDFVGSERTISVPLTSCSPGSYRIMLTVKSKDPNAVTIIMRVPYYFVVKE